MTDGLQSLTSTLELLTQLPGVGPARAAAIVAFHGRNLWPRLEADPRPALSCPGGVPGGKLSEAVQAWGRLRAPRALHQILSPIGLSEYVGRLIGMHGDDAPRALQADPYSLVLLGASFPHVDRLAARTQSARQDDALGRPEAALHAALRSRERRGDSCMTSHELLSAAAEILGTVVDAAVLDAAVASARLVRTDDLVWTPRSYSLETQVADHLHRLVRSSAQWPPLPSAVALTSAQRQAVATAWRSGISVCVGKAGTGKTHVIAALRDAAVANGLRVLACAPTGRAARNLEAATGADASTIHRLVDWSSTHDQRPQTTRPPLDADLVVVDEASLLDIELFGKLLDVVPDGTHLALFGDTTQLPSVGPGRVLSDIIDSAEVPSVSLPQVLRQSPRSAIALAAVAISEGHQPASTSLHDGGDFEIRPTTNASTMAERITRLVRVELPALYDVDPATEILVLCPGKRGPAGTTALNAALNAAMNPGAARLPDGVAGGDRVMWTTNDAGLGLANGTLLMLEPRTSPPGADDAPIRALAEDGRPLLIPADRHASMIPAWALTVHKSQGLEVPVVVVALHEQDTHPGLLSRAMLYTAITRASRAVVVCAEPTTLQRAIVRRGEGARRRTTLGRRLVTTLAAAAIDRAA